MTVKRVMLLSLLPLAAHFADTLLTYPTFPTATSAVVVPLTRSLRL